jgi:hypothetical protein
MENKMEEQPKSSKNRTWLIILGIIVVLILLSLAIPNVRASISSWLGLSVTSSEQVPASTVALEEIPTSAPVQAAAATQTPPTSVPATSEGTQSVVLSMIQSGASSGTTLDLSQLSSQIDWNVLTPGYLPEGYQFQSVYLDATNKMLVLTYLVTRPLPGSTDASLTSSETITLLQALHNDFVPMQVAPDTNIEDIQVNGSTGVFTTGGWDTQFVKDNSAPGGGKMVSSWRNDLPVKNLYWQIGQVYLALVTADETIDQQDMVNIATSIGK